MVMKTVQSLSYPDRSSNSLKQIIQQCVKNVTAILSAVLRPVSHSDDSLI